MKSLTSIFFCQSPDTKPLQPKSDIENSSRKEVSLKTKTDKKAAILPCGKTAAQTVGSISCGFTVFITYPSESAALLHPALYHIFRHMSICNSDKLKAQTPSCNTASSTKMPENTKKRGVPATALRQFKKSMTARSVHVPACF